MKVEFGAIKLLEFQVVFADFKRFVSEVVRIIPFNCGIVSELMVFDSRRITSSLLVISTIGVIIVDEINNFLRFKY